MTYAVKEIYFTIQGEGGQTGLPAVFLRFAGCNLWSGREQDRAKAICRFCDTDFIGTDGQGGGKFETAEALADAIVAAWPGDKGQKWVVCTGGEPLLQLDSSLIAALHTKSIKIAVETNGTIAAPEGIDWLCVSPKAGAALVQTSGHELKLVYPQTENRPEDFTHLDFKRFSLQPRDDSYLSGANKEAPTENHVEATLDYIQNHPEWALSLQTHKMIGIA